MARRIALLFVLLGVWLVPTPAYATSGQFQIRCQRIDHNVKDDPIVFPNQPGASHLHSFTGNTTTNAHSTYESMLGQPTTCRLSSDTSGYWVPAMHDAAGNVVAAKSTVYYRTWGSGPLTPFPPDFRLIAGGNTNASPVFGSKRAIAYSCSNSTAYSPTPPDCGSNWVKAEIIFPACWDGAAADSADHRSHVVYPTRGRCPADHPVRLPKLILSLVYAVHSGSGLSLSSDMAAGLPATTSLHADFWNTWDQPALEALVAKCLNAPKACNDVTDASFPQLTA